MLHTRTSTSSAAGNLSIHFAPMNTLTYIFFFLCYTDRHTSTSSAAGNLSIHFSPMNTFIYMFLFFVYHTHLFFVYHTHTSTSSAAGNLSIHFAPMNTLTYIYIFLCYTDTHMNVLRCWHLNPKPYPLRLYEHPYIHFFFLCYTHQRPTLLATSLSTSPL